MSPILPTPDIAVFDRAALRRHRERAAPAFGRYDFLFREVGERLLDRLDDIKRDFPLALDLGCHDGLLGRQLAGRGGIERLVEAELSAAMLARARSEAAATALPGPARQQLLADEEQLPFAESCFDLVMSNLALHWVNDLPGTLLQINRALKPDGLFLGAIFGGETLIELRESLMAAELELTGGAGPRVSPFAELRDCADLLQRAGFNLPVSDLDTITVRYPNALRLMEDLRGMGEANAVIERRKATTGRRLLLRAAEIYQERHALPDGRITATFQVLFLTAWRPHSSQQKPKAPGSARASLAEALGSQEVATGVKAAPGSGKKPRHGT